ncbi:hypothetical protein HOC37_05890 [bacterium]|nr:hypothetical protein [bacterium]MBT3581803.1 hypothetical protein [bacterium]MBT4552493.1 hypothetical protein [bacterium]MBT5988660.1 hypothetical protein [bacterium]MBT7087961.1 hypothetical protein [bacterium]
MLAKIVAIKASAIGLDSEFDKIRPPDIPSASRPKPCKRDRFIMWWAGVFSWLAK